MTARLLALVFVPVVGLLVLAGSLTRGRLDTASTASRIDEDTDRVARLVNARSALSAERVPIEALMRVGPMGISDSDAKQLLGFDLNDRLRSDVAATNTAVDALAADRDLVELHTLDDLRAAAANRTGDPQVVQKSYVDIDTRLTAAINQTVASIDGNVSQVAGGGRVNDALAAISASTDAVIHLTGEMQIIEGIFLSSGSQHASRDLAALATQAHIDGERLDAVRLPEIAEAWSSLKTSDAVKTFSTRVDETLDGNAVRLDDTSSLVQMAAVAREGLEFKTGIYALTRVSTDAVRQVAADLHASAIFELRQWLALSTLLIVATVAVSLLFARSVTRPLLRLAGRAAAVGAGDLDVEPLARSGGPRDLEVTFGAFDDMVANLRLLEAKAQALADCDFDAPVLSEQLPGELGRSLQESVRVLSGSIVERDLLQEHVAHQATHDALTGLHNRAAGNDALYLALMRARRKETGLAVLFIDLDDFKRANDTYGHAFGDQILCTIAERMVATVGDDGFLARLGSDEYMVLIEDLDDIGRATTMARSVLARVAAPIDITLTEREGLHLTISASIGIAFSWNGDEEPDQLLAWADLAVNRAKEHHRGGIEIYDKGLQEQLLQWAEIEEALNIALPQNELFLQYQPVTDLRTGQLTGVEALVRWARPDMGIQPPDSFIPVAESSNLIIELDQWVMARAARQISQWHDIPLLAAIDVAVNVSGRHLASQTLGKHVRELLAVTRINPRHLIIEITETVLVNDLIDAADQLQEIRALGVRIALDDFGTGYTSITHLQHLPVDIIKIDRSFVERLGNEHDRIVLAMITDLGHHLGLTITAEGVETAEQLAVLRELGCDRAQGFLLSRPLNVLDLEHLITTPVEPIQLAPGTDLDQDHPTAGDNESGNYLPSR